MTLSSRSAAFVQAGHAWVIADRSLRALEDAGPGDIVSLRTEDGAWLASALYCPGERILARVVSRDPGEACDAALFRKRAISAIELRARIAIDATQYRLINAEGDGLPGITADRYDDYLVVQLATPAAAPLVTPVVTAAMETERFRGVFLKMLPRDRRSGSGLPPGRWIDGVPGPGEMVTREGDIHFLVRPFSGLSTGVFLDQRDNRRTVGRLARGLRVLNTFAYTGGFSVACARAGATVDTLDISKPALEWARENFRLNDLDADPGTFIRADTFAHLERHGGVYDLIILDPPTFSTSRTGVWDARRVVDLHELAFAAVKPGGLVVTFTNTRKTTRSTFQDDVRGGARRAGRAIRVLALLEAGMDFPWDLGTPETRHLKGLVVRVD